ncbi:polysaccharide biosynthesis/export family protein [Capnocytophaga canis]|uniref:polysaccharide biosynthesis/export family protein n=1 Tax=Capnocytophaga canis TaxID=1848903 RepID=UPI0037D48360
MKKISVIICLVSILFSCTSRKNVAYFSDIENNKTEILKSYEIRLQPDDLLKIIINSQTEELLSDFNKTQNTGVAAVGSSPLQTYLIDKDGYITYPVIGNIKLGGLTRNEAIDVLTKAVRTFIKDATVNLRIANFKVTVQGEVRKPGTFTIESERITLLQALSMAEDMTIYGKRSHVVVIREQDGQRTFNVVDMSSSEFMNSDFYYLAQNDVVYVEPNKTRINSSVLGLDTSTILSAISVTITVIALLLKF